jgi:hypothetical protein
MMSATRAKPGCSLNFMVVQAGTKTVGNLDESAATRVDFLLHFGGTP